MAPGMSARGRTGFVLSNLEIGGAQRATIALVNRLQRTGHPVVLIVVDRVGPLGHDVGPEVETITLEVSRVARAGRSLRRTTLDHEIQTVVAVQSYVAAVAVAALVGTGVNVVANEQNDPVRRHHQMRGSTAHLLRLAMWITFRRADAVVACGDGVGRSIERFLHLPANRVESIFNPLDIDRIRALAMEPVRNPAPVVFVGRLAPQKRVDRILHAAVHLPQSIMVDLVGDGPSRRELEALAKTLGIAHRVRFRGATPNPYPHIAAADVLLMTSDHEGMGNVLTEALALDTIPIALDCEHGPREVLEGGRHGVLVTHFEPESFGRHIVDALGSRRAISPDAVDRFALDTVAAEWLELLDRVATP